MSDLLSIFAAEVRKREAAADAQAHAASKSAPQPDPTPSPKSNPKDTESRRWVLTLPLSEYTQAEVEKRLGRYKAVVGQLEAAPTTGYLHWQLYLETKSALRFSTLRKLFPKGHYEVASKTRIQAVKYATREDKRAASGEVINLGQLDLTLRQGKRTDLDSYSEQIMLEGKSAHEVIHDDPRAVIYASHLEKLELIRDRETWGKKFREIEVHYIHGGTRTGKTSALFETYGYEAIYRVPNWKNPFDGYRGQDILLLDEYNTSVAMVDLLKILEGYPLEVSARYSDKIAKFTKVFIVSNLKLSEQHQTIQQEHPKQWAALKARLTSISELVIDGSGDTARGILHVEKGTPPQLDHFLTGKPVEIVSPADKPAAGRASVLTAVEAAESFDDLDDADFFFDQD
ncbi:hypothetical protein [Microbacterium sp. SORGH_AS_0421]|uniref:hypothetical protein n=1 Tax=Microbacterium sp. SORGH_AS_0421 TaxID=3041768 RepID=UPI00278F71DA|nr:hypothetical protein [Microbacterium sp. SORGH_AS_0421]MDQ1175405.1 hypothetical protein [Microbacterium sp. SORGH_AS_0421]